MRERVWGYAQATFESAPDLGGLAGELKAFSALVASSADLRAVLSAVTVPAPVRAAIVGDLVGSRVSAPSGRLLGFVAHNSPAEDFVADVEALAAAAGARAGVPAGGTGQAAGLGLPGPLGRLGALDHMDGYATAVLSGLAVGPAMDEVEGQLLGFARAVQGNEQLAAALASGQLPGELRSAVVSELLSGRARPEVVRLATHAALVSRSRDYVSVLEALAERVAAESHRRLAEVTAAVDLGPSQRSRLAGALARLVGYDVEVRVTPNPQLLGGFVATVGSTVVDGSLRRRLERARELLVMPAGVLLGRRVLPGHGGGTTTERTLD